jgi:cytochrome c-type biogenesis protein
MAPMLAIVFKAGAAQPVYAGSLLLLYGIGHCAVIVAAGTCTEVVQNYLNWNEKSKGAAILKNVCGILVLLGGLYMVYTAP